MCVLYSTIDRSMEALWRFKDASQKCVKESHQQKPMDAYKMHYWPATAYTQAVINAPEVRVVLYDRPLIAQTQTTGRVATGSH
jgi:hypothetical protein